MKGNGKLQNILVFICLISVPTLLGAMCGYWLCLLLFVRGKFLIPFAIPEWLFWAIGGIIPIAALLQNLLIFRFYLYLKDVKKTMLGRTMLDFLTGFVPFWMVLFPWTLFWSTTCKTKHIAPHDAVQLFLSVLNGYLSGLPLLINAFIAAATIAIFVAFVMQSFRNLFGEYIAAFRLSRQRIQSGDGCVSAGN